MSSTYGVHGRRIAQNTLLNIFGQALPLIVTVAVTPTVFRGLGAERFGLLALVLIIIGFLGIFDLGLSRAVTNYAAESLSHGDRERLSTIVWTAASALTGLGIAAALLLAASTPTLLTQVLTVSPERLDEARASFYVLSLSLPVVLSTGAFRGALEAAQRFDILNAIGVPFTIVNIAFPVVGIHLGWNLDRIVGLMAVSRGVVLLVHYWFAARIFPQLATAYRFSRRELRMLARFGGWLAVSTVVGPIFLYTDRFIIGSLLGVSMVSYYAIPYDIVTRLWIVPAGLAVSLFPAFSILGTMRIEEAARYYARAQRFLLLFMGSAAMLLMVLGTRLLQVWMGPTFALQSASVLHILAFGAVTGSLAPISGVLLQGLGRPDIVAKVYTFLHLPMTVALLWFLVRKMGIEGAAVVTALRTTVDSVILLAFSARMMSPTAPTPTLKMLSVVGVLGAIGTLTVGGLAVTGGVHAEPHGILAVGGAATVTVWYGVLRELERRAPTRGRSRREYHRQDDAAPEAR